MEMEVRKVEMNENVADPTALGLLGLSVVCFVVSTSRVGWSGPTTSVIIPWAVLLGSLAQIIASYFDFKKNNAFGSVVFGAYGLFWSAMAGVWLIQMGAFGEALQKGFDVTQLAFAFVGFLFFSIFGTIASLKTNKVVFMIMVLIDFLFFGLATDLFLGGGTGFFKLAAWSELFISLLGFYGAGAVLVNRVFGKQVFPMGKSIL
ncbi:acetate uptake transporter [Veillonella agrestimuris]|uniref:acetate uptake transporter n=1 Tax=Veillonella agrestimuris TaxID=2941340 RepID=UPI0020426D0F|nr:acetate uptake transporter [Veillonella agrestimuris]